jgi:putative (di)nucleoside polyphosphate hydrolase
MDLLPPPPDLYRPNVGLLVFNQEGLAWIGRRRGFRGSYCWQTPQGGIDHGERVVDAALRELTEETGIDSSKVEILARTNEWLCYDFPESMRKSKLNHYKGQAQIWYAMRFNGNDDDIKLDSHRQIEFDDWRWEKLSLLPELVVPFKKGVYLQVIEYFSRFSA